MKRTFKNFPKILYPTHLPYDGKTAWCNPTQAAKWKIEVEAELREEKRDLEVKMEFADSEGKHSFFDGQLRKVEELLGGADET